MPPVRRSPLFHAIVLSGASLAAACGKEAVTQPSDVADTGADASTPSDGASDAAVTDAAVPDACPPGSERPVPPCYFIK